MSKTRHPIFNPAFALLCTSSFLFSASFNMLIPELPAYLGRMGGGEYKGLIIALFTVTAGISRPFSGKLTDTIGRVPVMAVGSVVCFVCGFLYPLIGTVFGFLMIRLIHGFSTGFKPTATAAYVADIVPTERWGEALGIHGLCFSTGMAIGPAIGSAITSYFSINVLFYCSSLFALFSILILANMKDTLSDKKRFNISHLRIGRDDVFESRVIPAAVVTFLAYLSYGAMLTLVPDWTSHLGIANKGMFFMVFTLSSLLIRFFAGRVSDQYGRVVVLRVALVILLLSLILIGTASSPISLLLASVVYGFATGIISPTTSAWTVDLSRPEKRGKAMATMYISLEAGIGIGAFVAGQFYHDNVQNIPAVFYLMALCSFLAIAYLSLRQGQRA